MRDPTEHAGDPAIRALEKGLSAIADAYGALAAALTSTATATEPLLDGSKLAMTLGSHLIAAACTAERSILEHGASLVAGDEHAGQRLLTALRCFQLTMIEAATKPAGGQA